MVTVRRLSGVVPQTPRRRWVIGMVIFAVAYVTLLVAYFYDGQGGAFEGHTDGQPPDGGVLVSVEFNGIDPADRVMLATVGVELDGALQDLDVNGGLLSAPKQDLTIDMGPTTDGGPLVYPAGEAITFKQVRIPTESGSGYIRDWPFDRYRNILLVTDASGAGNESLPVTVSFAGAAQGWHVSADPLDPDAPADSKGLVYSIEFRRSLGVVLFGIAILLVLISLPFLALWVVTNVYRGKRRFEPAFLSWIAALLFAVITIRNFLPGAPPAGSWVDVAVVIWVMIALTTALFFGVGSWWRHSRPDR